MRIRISHEITHRYAPPARMLIQNLRLTPHGFDSQYVLGWRIEVDIDSALRQSEDAHGNVVTTFSHHGAPIERLTVSASGEIETSDAAGVVRGAVERLPAEMYLRDSPLAHVNGALRDFASEATAGAVRSARRHAPSDGRSASGHDLRSVRRPTIPNRRSRPLRCGAGRRATSLISSSPARASSAFRRASSAATAPPRTPAGKPGAHAWAEAHVARARLGRLRPDRLPLRRRRVTCGSSSASTPGTARSSGARTGASEDAVETAIRVEQAGLQSQA